METENFIEGFQEWSWELNFKLLVVSLHFIVFKVWHIIGFIN